MFAAVAAGFVALFAPQVPPSGASAVATGTAANGKYELCDMRKCCELEDVPKEAKAKDKEETDGADVTVFAARDDGSPSSRRVPAHSYRRRGRHSKTLPRNLRSCPSGHGGVVASSIVSSIQSRLHPSNPIHPSLINVRGRRPRAASSTTVANTLLSLNTPPGTTPG